MGMVRVQRVNQQGPWGDKESCEAGDWEDKGKYPRVMVVASQEMAMEPGQGESVELAGQRTARTMSSFCMNSHLCDLVGHQPSQTPFSSLPCPLSVSLE